MDGYSIPYVLYLPWATATGAARAHATRARMDRTDFMVDVWGWTEKVGINE